MALCVAALYLLYQRLVLPFVERVDQVGENISDVAAVGTFAIMLALVLMPHASVTTTCAASRPRPQRHPSALQRLLNVMCLKFIVDLNP